MSKIIIAMDSFKGTMSSFELNRIIKERFNQAFNNLNIKTFLISDGGEGLLECLKDQLDFDLIKMNSLDLNFKKIKTFYLLNQEIAYIESAKTCGLTLCDDNKDPSIKTTYGLGLQIYDAILKGAKKIIVGLGGSGTNDCGCGMLSALKVHFYDQYHNEFIPSGHNLNEIKDIDLNDFKQIINGIEFVCLSDVNNPLYGKNGSSYVFGPQKGANQEMVKLLDHNLKQFSNLVFKKYQIDNGMKAKTGAAGGLGYAFMTFMNAEMLNGIDYLLDLYHFKDEIKDADLIITGEGQIDAQSLMGKALSGILKFNKDNNAKVITISGSLKDGYEELYKHGVDAMFITNKTNRSLDQLDPLLDLNICLDDIINIMKMKSF